MKLLVSVRNLHEAQRAVDAGVAIVDVKEPTNGPLGRAGSAVLDQIGQLADRTQLSAACGELVESQGTLDLSLKRYRFLKFGLSGIRDADEAVSQLAEMSHRDNQDDRLVPVAYFDHLDAGSPPPAALIEAVLNPCSSSSFHCSHFLFDTFTKNERVNLFDFVESTELADWIGRLQEQGICVALAGSITQDLIAAVELLSPDIIGVRGAVCTETNRKASIDMHRLVTFHQALRRGAARC